MKSQIAVDLKKNRVVVFYRGEINKNVAASLYTDARFAAADLLPGFDIISDFSECKLAHVSALPTMRKIILYLIEKGAGEAIRILGNESLVKKQVINLATWIPGHKPVYVGSMEEAEEKLATMVRRDGMRIQFHDLSVEYIYDDFARKGLIDNISISGCAVSCEIDVPQVGMEIPLIFIRKKNDENHEIQILGKVVRADVNGFAVHFNHEEKSKKELFAFVLEECQRSLQELGG